ncbi:MAG: VF530 family protein [Candidatus Nomurabacteria bacterium]|nr:VF530 family protein [Candidatus Nomurabacteria bacterium]
MKPNYLHNKTLKIIMQELVDDYGWEKLGTYIRIKCFQSDPSISSSLKFLRRTPWAREKVENLYIAMMKRRERK